MYIGFNEFTGLISCVLVHINLFFMMYGGGTLVAAGVACGMLPDWYHVMLILFGLALILLAHVCVFTLQQPKRHNTVLRIYAALIGILVFGELVFVLVVRSRWRSMPNGLFRYILENIGTMVVSRLFMDYMAELSADIPVVGDILTEGITFISGSIGVKADLDDALHEIKDSVEGWAVYKTFTVGSWLSGVLMALQVLAILLALMLSYTNVVKKWRTIPLVPNTIIL